MKRLIQAVAVIIILVNVFSTAFILYETERTIGSATARAASEGHVSFCINQPPTLSVPCDPNMSQDQPYSCQLVGVDPGNLTFFQVPQPPDEEPVFNISPSGLIDFTPTNDDRGNHSTLIGVDDGSGCENAYAYEYFNFTVANVNDPPYLIRAIPDQTLNVNTTLFAFFLRDYIADPDLDPLSFVLIPDLSEVFILATINPDSSVAFSGSQCGKAHFKFLATDPYGLSVESNAVQVEVNCDPVPEPGGGEGSGAGAGGGGGGGSPICRPELVCMPWSECYPTGLQVQVCKDQNGCSDTEIKFYQDCTYIGEQPLCDENWLCSEWDVCSAAALQNRTCSDLNECGTTRYMPPLSQECVYNPTCSDGAQNGDETGVDCGGSCPACRTIQEPTTLEGGGFLTIFTTIAILLLLVLLALFVLYRERVYEGLARLGWMLAPEREKELLLTAPEKKVMFEDLALIEQSLLKEEPAKVYTRLAAAVRKYYSFALDIPFEYLLEESAQALAKARLSDELRSALAGFSSRLSLLESGNLPPVLNRSLVSSVVEELRLLVCMTSEYDVSEIARELAERKPTPSMSFGEEIRLRLLNAHDALQFRRVEIAREEYVAILRAYDSLAPEQKALFYLDIHRLYVETKYVQETAS